MAKSFRIAIVSDIHYAAAAERAFCADYNYRKEIKNPVAQIVAKLFHHFIWLRKHGAHNHLLDFFLKVAASCDVIIANGDFATNARSLGMSDDAAFAGAQECLERLRSCGAGAFYATLGDHELGKTGMFTGRGGMSLASWQRAVNGLGLEPFWRVQLGNYVLLGVTSSLIALPTFMGELRAEEIPEWERLRKIHLQTICDAFARVKPEQRVLLFCHDPTALPFLGREAIIREKLSHVEQTIIGHLHSNLVLRGSRVLAGLPTIPFFGNGVRRTSAALGAAQFWKPFHVRLCPSLTGIQLLKDGGFLTAELDADASRPALFKFHRIRW
jgi:hypothetical protein